MNGSVRLGTIAGIGIFVHWTFLLLVGWYAIYGLSTGGAGEAIYVVALLLAVFGCIVLHELGHALTARHYGIKTRDITLLPIGGVARLERMPEEPWQEFWVAVAGPAVNVAIAIVLFFVLLVYGGMEMLGQVQLIGGPLLVNLLVVNIGLVLFNLVPAFPMDGGRVLRAVLAGATGNYLWASQTAATIGKGFAILFGILGLFTQHFMLIFIALFVYLAAQEEANQAAVRSLFQGWPVREAMMTRFRVLAPEDPLSGAIDELLAGAQQDFPVVSEDRVVGMLSRQDLFRALNDGQRDQRVGDVAQATCQVAEDTEMLEPIMRRMRELGCSTLPVVHRGKLVGLLTLENIGELMMVQNAVQQVKRS